MVVLEYEDDAEKRKCIRPISKWPRKKRFIQNYVALDLKYLKARSLCKRTSRSHSCIPRCLPE